jgi:hypothetical protein
MPRSVEFKEEFMANTFGQTKANEESAWQNNREMNPQVNSSVTDDEITDTEKHETETSAWRATDSPVESPTSSEFDDAEAAKRNENIKTETPGLHPDVAE